jgi:hypothetical protein
MFHTKNAIKNTCGEETMSAVRSIKQVCEKAARKATELASASMTGATYFSVSVEKNGRYFEAVFERDQMGEAEASFTISAFSGQIYDASIPWASKKVDWSNHYLKIDLDTPEDTEEDVVNQMAQFLLRAISSHRDAMSSSSR